MTSFTRRSKAVCVLSLPLFGASGKQLWLLLSISNWNAHHPDCTWLQQHHPLQHYSANGRKNTSCRIRCEGRHHCSHRNRNVSCQHCQQMKRQECRRSAHKHIAKGCTGLYMEELTIHKGFCPLTHIDTDCHGHWNRKSYNTWQRALGFGFCIAIRQRHRLKR